MKTFRVIQPFTLSDLAGTREYGPEPGQIHFITEAEIGPYGNELDHCLTETAAPAPLEPAEEPEL